MAATPTLVNKKDLDLACVAVVDVLLDNSYPTGGYALTEKQLGMRVGKVDKVEGFAAGFVFEWDAANKKLLAYYGNYDAADGALIEVANGVDLSAVTVRLTVYGR